MKCLHTILTFAAILAPPGFAEDFKTIRGKEYKDAAITRIEPDGIVLKTKSGISKVYPWRSTAWEIHPVMKVELIQ